VDVAVTIKTTSGARVSACDGFRVEAVVVLLLLIRVTLGAIDFRDLIVR
jgi:hypothetical protein